MPDLLPARRVSDWVDLWMGSTEDSSEASRVSNEFKMPTCFTREGSDCGVSERGRFSSTWQ